MLSSCSASIELPAGADSGSSSGSGTSTVAVPEGVAQAEVVVDASTGMIEQESDCNADGLCEVTVDL